MRLQAGLGHAATLRPPSCCQRQRRALPEPLSVHALTGFGTSARENGLPTCSVGRFNDR